MGWRLVLLAVLKIALGSVDYKGLYGGLYEGELKEFLDGNREASFQRTPEVLTLLLNGTLDGYRQMRQRWLPLRLFFRPQMGRRALDLGCGEGQLVSALRRLQAPNWCGFSALKTRQPFVAGYGVDVSPPRVEMARKQNGCQECFKEALLTELPFRTPGHLERPRGRALKKVRGNGSFDTVFTTHVLEHLTKPDLELVMREVRRLLLPNPWAMFVAIVSTVPENMGSSLRLPELHQQQRFLEIQNLHLTVEKGIWWRHFFERQGFVCPHYWHYDHWHWSFMDFVKKRRRLGLDRITNTSRAEIETSVVPGLLNDTLGSGLGLDCWALSNASASTAGRLMAATHERCPFYRAVVPRLAGGEEWLQLRLAGGPDQFSEVHNVQRQAALEGLRLKGLQKLKVVVDALSAEVKPKQDAMCENSGLRQTDFQELARDAERSWSLINREACKDLRSFNSGIFANASLPQKLNETVVEVYEVTAEQKYCPEGWAIRTPVECHAAAVSLSKGWLGTVYEEGQPYCRSFNGNVVFNGGGDAAPANFSSVCKAAPEELSASSSTKALGIAGSCDSADGACRVGGYFKENLTLTECRRAKQRAAASAMRTPVASATPICPEPFERFRWRPHSRGGRRRRDDRRLQSSTTNWVRDNLARRKILVAPYKGEVKQLLDMMVVEALLSGVEERSESPAIRRNLWHVEEHIGRFPGPAVPVPAGAWASGAELPGAHGGQHHVLGLCGGGAGLCAAAAGRGAAGALVFNSADAQGNFPADMNVDFSIRAHAQLLPSTARVIRRTSFWGMGSFYYYPYLDLGFALLEEDSALSCQGNLAMASGLKGRSAAKVGRECLGRELLEVFAETARVAGCGRGELELQAMRSRLPEARLWRVDLCEAAEVEQMALELQEHFGQLDLLVAAAGFMPPNAPLGDSAPDAAGAWRRTVEVNVLALAQLLRSFAPLMAPKGAIVVLSSRYGRAVAPGMGCYSATKWATEAMAKTLALELLSREVAVVSLDPGVVNTEMLRQNCQTEEASSQARDAGRERYFISGVMLGSQKQLGEAAGVVVPSISRDTAPETLTEAGLAPQNYRQQISDVIRKADPEAVIVDPLEVVQQKAARENSNLDGLNSSTGAVREAFLEVVGLVQTCDVIVSHLPEASMGSAVELWEARKHQLTVLTISPMKDNWTIRSVTDHNFADLADFEANLSAHL
ncbi:unnamed protein product [Effrenium voratum]|nr:unnamed protein product [Effrenium voratum]